MSEICGENYEIQCGEVFLHLMNGKLTFHCTLCETLCDNYQNYADHVASEHSPSMEWEEEDVHINLEVDGTVKPEFINDEETPIKEEKEEYLFDEDSFNSFADEYEQEDHDLLNELEVGPEDLTEEIFVDTEPNEISVNTNTAKRPGRGLKPKPLIIPAADDARPVKIKYINKDDERKFRCPNCDFSCKLKRNLKGHLRRHLKERPFKCTACEKGFYTSTELKVHTRSHTGERPYACTECNDSFITLAKLNEHRRLHAETPPSFQCDQCGKIFNSASRLRAHGTTCLHKREKPHKCTKCDARFDYILDLKNHYQLHEHKKTYECVICESQFTERSSLHSHLKSKHMGIYL